MVVVVVVALRRDDARAAVTRSDLSKSCRDSVLVLDPAVEGVSVIWMDFYASLF